MLAVRDGLVHEPEKDWLEWKSDVVLGDKRWQAELAKHVLGFANRDPARAQRAAEGTAYLLAGVEPGELDGVAPLDPAKLEAAMAAYLGTANGPAWDADYIDVEGKTVLVLTVEPPRSGDPPWPLRREYQSLRDGTVYVRRQGQTAPATSAEIDMLVRRARATPARLAVDVRPAATTPVVPVDTSEAARTAWLAIERTRLLAPLEADHLRPVSMAEVLRLGSAFDRDTRSREAYREEVERYLEKAERALPARLRARAVARRLGPLDLVVENLTEDNYSSLEVEVRLEGRVASYFAPEQAEDEADVPRRPIPWGRQKGWLPAPSGFPWTPRAPWVSFDAFANGDGFATATFRPFDLRSLERHALPTVYVVVDAAHRGQALPGTWRATSTSVSGVAEGALAVEVSADAWPLPEVMAYPEDEEE